MVAMPCCRGRRADVLESLIRILGACLESLHTSVGDLSFFFNESGSECSLIAEDVVQAVVRVC